MNILYKKRNEIFLNSNTHNRLLVLQRKERTAPCTDSTVASAQQCWKVGDLASLVGGPRDRSRRTSYTCSPFLTFQRPALWWTFVPNCFQSHICECCNFSSCNVKINMSKNSVKDLQGVSLLQLILTEKTDWEVGLGPCNVWFSYCYWSRVVTVIHEKLNPTVCAKRKWWSDCAERSAVLALLFIHNSPILRPSIRKSHDRPLVVSQLNTCSHFVLLCQ